MDIPVEISQVLGFTHSERIHTLVLDVIRASEGKTEACQSEEKRQAMAALREFMFENVYRNPVAKGEEGKAQDMVKALFEYYVKNPDELPADFQTIRVEEGVERAVCDYVSGMTDNFAVETYSALFIPKAWTVK